MLQIRNQQFDKFSDTLRDRANLGLAEYARKRFPRKFATTAEEDLVALASRVRMTAKTYGIEREDNVATFLDFTVMYGEEFHRDPWAAGVLKNRAMHGPDKMALLRYQVELTGVTL
jgi:hypothetical protein